MKNLQMLLVVTLLLLSACSTVESTGQAVNSAGQGVGEAVSGVGRGAGRIISGTGEAIEDGARKTERKGY